MLDAFADVSTLLSNYALGYDTQNASAVADCFHDEATFDLLLPDGQTMTFTGRPAIEAFMQEQLSGQQDLRRHFTTNIRVIERGEGVIRIGCYLLLGAIDSQGLRIVQSGRYEDTIEWADGKAIFRSRHLTMDGTF
ncbi:unannotated protein [freshwater metagenome]|uniref:Unannotated protein n=1 Tax=freshwater metagenome TaxID=449393 RepID=A0A6J7IT92_9ZZZZ|nr:hypothetical protein [Actinomycetota bacterium]